MGLLNKIIDFEPIIDRAVNTALSHVPAIIDAVEKRVQALLPLLVAAAVKAFAEHAERMIRDNVPFAGDVLAEKARTELNQIPDIDIPGLSEHFDLTEWLRGTR